MLQYHWTSTTITTNAQANAMVSLFKELAPVIGGNDTETTGLHIILDKPFIFQFGFVDPNKYEGYTYLVDLERYPDLARQVIKVWHKLAATLKEYVGHHHVFDQHMVRNIGLPYEVENMTDSMFYIRYGHDALQQDSGGPPLKLKEYATRYIDHKAKSHEKLLKEEQSTIAKNINIKLKQRLSKLGKPPDKFGAKSYTLGVIQDMFKDPIMDYTDLPEDVKEIYLDWLHQDVPIWMQHQVTALVEPEFVKYNYLNRENLYRYAHYDIIYTLETVLSLKPVIKARGQELAIKIENSLIMPLIEMERVGFKADKQYLLDSKTKMKAYIKERRVKLFDIAQQEFAIGQHELIKTIMYNEFNLQVASTNAEELSQLKSELIRKGNNETAVEFITILQELRTLEKWYSAYIMRFLKELHFTDRLYTGINQVGAVSGRVTSDFQQFPREPIKTIDGEELFYPRRIVQTSGGNFDAIVYLDYSQIELRFQAMYTILVGHPDTNMCRAYMPYNCIDPNGVPFDYNNPKHIALWAAEWYYAEDPSVHWTPTDLHGESTKNLFLITDDHPEFKKFRYDGKRYNFAKNYGAGLAQVMAMFPTYSKTECIRMNGAYYQTFPGVKEYHNYCYARAANYSYTENIFGIKYYNVSGHKLRNILIQGGAAFFLKLKIRELYEYRKAHNIKSVWQMQIHDELSWEKHVDDNPEVFFEFQRIMENLPDTIVPIIAEMEVTTTTWAEKKGVHSLNELQNRLVA